MLGETTIVAVHRTKWFWSDSCLIMNIETQQIFETAKEIYKDKDFQTVCFERGSSIIFSFIISTLSTVLFEETRSQAIIEINKKNK